MKTIKLALAILLSIAITSCSGGGGGITTTTSDTTAPSNTTANNFINSGASSTSSITVTLSILATDSVGVTGYYASETSTTPSATATGWTSITSAASYSASVSFTLSSGDGTKTVYVWFKDAAGNVSASVNDSIDLAKFPIATTTQKEIGWSSAFDVTNYLVAFQEALDVKAQLVSQSGTLVSSAIAVGLTGGIPAVAFDGTNYLLVSPPNASSIQGQFVSTAGSPVGSPFNITTAGTNIQYQNPGQVLYIIFDGNNYFVMWNDERYLKGQFVSPAGGLIGDPITICAGTGPYSEIPGTFNVGFDGNKTLAVWNDGRRVSACGESFCPLDIYGQFITKSGVGTSGALSGSNFAINVNDDWSDMSTIGLAFDGTNYLVAWNDMTPYTDENARHNARLYAQLVSTSGTLIGGVIDTGNTTANYERGLPFLAFDGNNYLLIWTSTANDLNQNNICDAGEGTCFDIYGQFINKSGVLQGSEIVISNNAGSQFGALTFGGGKYLVIQNNIDDLDGTVGDVYGVFVTP